MPGITLADEKLAAMRRGEAVPCRPHETLYVNRGYLRNRILAHCAGRPVADIDRQDEPQRTSRWVLPALRGEKPRAPVGLDRFRDVGLHDLRHTHASIAPRQGETVLAIARLRPREREYTVWDNRVPSLGRVRPSGGKRYPLLEETGERSKRAAPGPVSTRSVEEARTECHERQANPEPEIRAVPPRIGGTFGGKGPPEEPTALSAMARKRGLRVLPLTSARSPSIAAHGRCRPRTGDGWLRPERGFRPASA